MNTYCDLSFSGPRGEGAGEYVLQYLSELYMLPLVDPTSAACKSALLGQFCHKQLFWVSFVMCNTFAALPHNRTRLHTPNKFVIGHFFESILS